LFDKCKDSLRDINDLILKSSLIQKESNQFNPNSPTKADERKQHNINENDELVKNTSKIQINQQLNNNKEILMSKDENKNENILINKEITCGETQNIENIIKNNIMKTGSKMMQQQANENSNNANNQLINEQNRETKAFKS